MTTSRRSRTPLALLAAVAGTLVASGFTVTGSGCSREAEPAAEVDRGTPSAVYTVRGRVASLPDPANPTSDFQVRHEAIDNFVDSTGRVVGMGAMVMPFPLAEGVSIADLSVDDVVEVEFAVWWKPRRHWEATRVEKLPPETLLEFRAARPPEATEPGGATPAEDGAAAEGAGGAGEG